MPATLEAAPKSERLEARLTTDQKELLLQAASLEGRTLTDFVVSTLQEAARNIVQKHQIVAFSDRDRALFIDALLNPPEPGKRLRAAAARHRLRSRR